MYGGFLKLEKSEDGQQKLAKTTLLEFSKETQP